MRHGNRWLRGILVQAAWAAIKVRGSSFGARFRRIAKGRGDKRGAIAVAHSLLTVVYHVLTRDEPYRDLGGDSFDRRKPEQQARYYARRLAELGFEVSLDLISVA